MIRNLLIISGAGLVLAIVGIGGSLAMGGADLARNSWTWAIDDNSRGGFNIHRTVEAEVQPMATRTLDWADTQRLTVSLPGKVTYVQTDAAPGITLTGPQDLIDRITFQNGQLLMTERAANDTAYVRIGRDGITGWSDSETLRITINANSVQSFELQGNTDLEVRGYDKPSLELVLTGGSDIEMQGRTQTLKVDASGHSRAELDDLLTTDATITTTGNAGVKTSANGMVVVDGSGDSAVRLTRRPAELRQTLSGDAEVRQD